MIDEDFNMTDDDYMDENYDRMDHCAEETGEDGGPAACDGPGSSPVWSIS
jgi:hypothetical protein